MPRHEVHKEKTCPLLARPQALASHIADFLTVQLAPQAKQQQQVRACRFLVFWLFIYVASGTTKRPKQLVEDTRTGSTSWPWLWSQINVELWPLHAQQGGFPAPIPPCAICLRHAPASSSSIPPLSPILSTPG